MSRVVRPDVGPASAYELPEELAARLGQRIDGQRPPKQRDRHPARVVLTHNRVRMVSVRQTPAALEVRVARRLLALGPEAVEAVACFAMGRERARLRELIRTLPAEASPARRTTIITRGRHHDLEPLFRAEALGAFGAVPEGVQITWGPRRRVRRRQRTIRLGSYSWRSATIRVHRILDHPAVPAWFIGFVVFHELLHHMMPGKGSGTAHSKAFRERESQHARFGDAAAWEGQTLPRLLSGRLGPG